MTLDPDTPLRQKAYDYLQKVQDNLPMESRGRNSDLYVTYTGNNQKFFEEHWAENRPTDFTTGCNGFTATYSVKGLGGPYVGGFYMDNEVPRAWVPSTATTRPGFGDICLQWDRHHVYVILNDDPFTTIQAGYNGSGRKAWTKGPDGKAFQPGIDVIGVGHGGTWDHTKLLGWLDIDKLKTPQIAVPFWGLGWWSVTWDEDTYYYYFATDWQVYWTNRKPRSVTEICANVPNDGGVGSFHVNQTLNIKWRSGSKEQFWYGDKPVPMEFWGKHNGQGVLHVKRL